MATRPLIPSASRGLLGNYDGATVGVLLVDHDGAAAADEAMEFVSEVAGDELLDPGDRGTVDVTFTVEGDEGVFDLDPEGDTYAPDTTGTTPAGAWFFDTTGGSDAARRLLCFLPVAEGPGFADWELLAPPAGLARLKLTPGEFGDLDDVDLTTTPPVSGQVPTWADDGAGGMKLVPGTGAAAPSFIYNSSGAQAGNRYNDETALWAAVAAAPFGAKDIIVEQNETFTTPTINLNGGGFLGVNTRILLSFDGSVTQITNPGGFLARNAVFLYNTSLTDSVLKVDSTHANSVILEDSCAILAAGVDGDGPGFIEITEASGAAGIGLNNAHLYKPSDYSIGSSSTDGPALVVTGATPFPYIGCGWGHCELKPDTIKAPGTVQIVNFTAGLDAGRTPGDPVLPDQTMATVSVFLDTNLAANIKYGASDVHSALDALMELASSIATAAATAASALADASDLAEAQAALAPFLAAFTAP